MAATTTGRITARKSDNADQLIPYCLRAARRAWD